MSNGILFLESTSGSLNLSEYLNVQEGDGMDPADPSFTEKIFAHSLLKQGGTLALENFKLRELVFPLLLKASTKTALTALVREINTIINTSGAVASWQDVGATAPTYFQLSSAQLDPEFKYRRGEYNWLDGKLRLFVQPFGLIEKNPRELAQSGTTAMTVTGTAPVITFSSASQVRGDYAALAEGNVSWNASAGPVEFGVAFSVLPSPSYTPWQAAPSYTGWVASSGEGWNFRTGNGTILFKEAGEVYVGANRCLAVVRNLSNASAAMIAAEAYPIETNQGGAASLSGVAVPSTMPSTWALVDCGVLSIPSYSSAGGWYLQVNTSASVNLAGMVLLPENKTSWLLGEPNYSPEEIRDINFNGVLNRVLAGFLNEAQDAHHDLSAYARGAIPQVPVGGINAPVFAFLHHHFTDKKPVLLTGSVQILERTRYVF